MTEKTEDYGLEKSKKRKPYKEESIGPGTNERIKDYLEMINVIDSLMKDKKFYWKT